MAFRLLDRRGEWDVDAFFASIPASKWHEYKIAKILNDDYDDWLRTPARREKKHVPPTFATGKRVRRRLDGTPY